MNLLRKIHTKQQPSSKFRQQLDFVTMNCQKSVESDQMKIKKSKTFPRNSVSECIYLMLWKLEITDLRKYEF